MTLWTANFLLNYILHAADYCAQLSSIGKSMILLLIYPVVFHFKIWFIAIKIFLVFAVKVTKI